MKPAPCITISKRKDAKNYENARVHIDTSTYLFCIRAYAHIYTGTNTQIYAERERERERTREKEREGEKKRDRWIGGRICFKITIHKFLKLTSTHEVQSFSCM